MLVASFVVCRGGRGLELVSVLVRPVLGDLDRGQPSAHWVPQSDPAQRANRPRAKLIAGLLPLLLPVGGCNRRTSKTTQDGR
jgi:hypothetical protein